jgi:hypothetical protein
VGGAGRRPTTSRRTAVPGRDDSPDVGRATATWAEGSTLDDYTHDDYLAATTREYQGLAEEIAAAEQLDYERQAVAAVDAGRRFGSGRASRTSPVGAECRRRMSKPRSSSAPPT